MIGYEKLNSGQDGVSLHEREYFTRALAKIVYEIERSDWI